jgi:hypothetical protein
MVAQAVVAQALVEHLQARQGKEMLVDQAVDHKAVVVVELVLLVLTAVIILVVQAVLAQLHPLLVRL